MSGLVERAKYFALNIHGNQHRLNKARTLLVKHLEEVVLLVKCSGGSEIEIAAAWLHDVIEDTSVTLDEVIDHFDEEVANIVDGLTDLPEFKSLHTLERKTAQAKRICYLNDSVKRVKLADQISNVRSVADDPPVHWNAQKCLDYVNGAEMIAWECKDVSGRLFGLFCRAHTDALVNIRAKERME